MTTLVGVGLHNRELGRRAVRRRAKAWSQPGRAGGVALCSGCYHNARSWCTGMVYSRPAPLPAYLHAP
jgi:hypothetical protein